MLATQVLSLIDLTSLNTNDTDQEIIQLCGKARNQFGQVAALCVFPQFIETALDSLHSHHIKGVRVATVSNFPHGKNNPSITHKEVEKAVLMGAQEVDVVFPYSAFMAGDTKIAEELVVASKDACSSGVKLKVILETGALKTERLIRQASELCIEHQADFLKTSTGKVSINATYDAASFMLDTIKQSGKNVGFKASGGIRNLMQASEYMSMASNIMGDNWVCADNFRFGASSLLDDLITELQ